MKQNLNVMNIWICLSMLIAPASALADVTIPYIFSNGTTAVASQVNEDFQAFNTRQAATFASMAGTYTFQITEFSVEPQHYFDADKVQIDILCVKLTSGTITLMSGGNLTMALTESSSCGSGGSAAVAGTYSVSAAGSGTIALNGGKSMTFKASKDLNTLLLRNNTNFMQGTAIRN
jgi:hypothetical protein